MAMWEDLGYLAPAPMCSKYLRRTSEVSYRQIQQQVSSKTEASGKLTFTSFNFFVTSSVIALHFSVKTGTVPSPIDSSTVHGVTE